MLRSEVVTKIGSYIVLALLISLSAWAANIKVDAVVDRNSVNMGEPIRLTLTVSSNENVDVGSPSLPPLSGLELLNTFTSSGTSSRLTQGPRGMEFETSHQQKFTYVLAPTQTGQLSVDSLEVVVDGKAYKTNPILINVSKSGANPRQQQAPQNNFPPGFDDAQDPIDEAEEMFNQLLQRRGMSPPGAPGGNMPGPTFKTGPPANPNEAFFLQVEVDKTEAYEGEQVTANWYIYTRGLMESPERLKFPDLRGFWKEIVEEVPALNFQQEVINGIAYQRALLASHALFPIKSGKAVIDEFKLRAKVRLPSNGFGGFNYGQPYAFTKSSQRIEINVKPIPVEGRPADFAGAVGNFDIKVRVEGQTVPANQPFPIRVRFEGRGNAKLIELPSLNLPAALEIYNTKNESKFFKEGTSFKEFEVLVIPRQEGEFTIPSISFSMFDPQTRKYMQKKSDEIVIKVTPAQQQAGVAANRVNSEAKKIKETGLPELLLNPEEKSSMALNSLPAGVWIAIQGLIALALLVQSKFAFGWGAKKVDLQTKLKDRYKRIGLAVHSSDYRSVGAEMTNAIYMVLGELSHLGDSGHELHKLLDHLPPSVRRDFGDQISKYLDQSQILAFAPESMVGELKTESKMKALVADTQATLEKIIAASQ
jgi:hypothetical protein